MDKGLIRIQELNKELKGLNLDKTQNDASIREEVEKNSILEEKIFDLEQEIESLNGKKIAFENARKNRKKEKKETVLMKLLAYIILLFVFSLIFLSSVYLIPSVILLTAGSILSSVISIPIQFNKINKRYPEGDISKVQEEIEQLRHHLTDVVSKKNKSEVRLENLQKLRKYQEALIQNILQEKSSIETLRAKVIEEYCNNNPELEEKIDKAYDEDIKVKEKVKTM